MAELVGTRLHRTVGFLSGLIGPYWHVEVIAEFDHIFPCGAFRAHVPNGLVTFWAPSFGELLHSRSDAFSVVVILRPKFM